MQMLVMIDCLLKTIHCTGAMFASIGKAAAVVLQEVLLSAGATVTSIGKAAAEEAAWAKLQRSAVWWLGEHANAAAMEYAGDNEAVKATAGINAAMQKVSSPGEIIALQVCAVMRCAVLCGAWPLQMLLLQLSECHSMQKLAPQRSTVHNLWPYRSLLPCHVDVSCFALLVLSGSTDIQVHHEDLSSRVSYTRVDMTIDGASAVKVSSATCALIRVYR